MKTNNYYLELIYDFYLKKNKEELENSSSCSICGKLIPHKERTKHGLCYFHLLKITPEVEKK